MSRGCSGGQSWLWRTFLRRPPPWEGCCDEHDYLYAAGGPAFLRRVADRRLRDCVRARGYPIQAAYMYRLVRFGGWPFWPTNYRWGFGQPYGTGYTSMSGGP